MMFGDGTVTLAKNRIVPRMVYNTGSKKLADQFQILAIKCGYSANINSNLRIGSGFSGSKGTYKVNIRYGKRSILIKPQINKYDGYVYCVNVPNHVIMVRRNNKTAFCGNCYDEGKRCAETLFYSYRKQHDLDTKIVRIFNAYGPNMNVDDGRVISNFIVQALQNKPITVYGNGTQTRSFQYVDDMIEGFIKMMNSKEHGPINIGNPGEFTVIELANKIIKLTNSNSKIIHMDLPADDPKQRRPDISLAKKLLNWEPKVNLDDGLVKTIEYFRKNI
jgi:UDP-glucuronate decarboxylase